MIKWIVIFFVILILILIIFYNLANWVEDKALFHPSKKRCWKPRTQYKSVYLNVENKKDVCYNSKDKKKGCQYIHGWHFDNFEGAKTILFCHGNSGSINDRKYIIDICHKFKLNLFVFDIIAFGLSSGCSPNKFFLKENGETAFNYLHHHCGISNRQIIVWGESLGCVTASFIASKHKCGALIIFCGFSSLDDAVTYKFKGGKRTAVKFLTDLLAYRVDMLDVKDYLLDVECPVVIIHSPCDDIIPYSCSWINYHSVKHADKMHVKIKGGHSSPNIKSCQLRKIFNFCNLSLDNLSSNVEISEILENLKTFAKKHNNFMD